MRAVATIQELYGRIAPLVRTTVDGLDAEQLHDAPVADANTMGWLVWHLTRIQDHHVAELMRVDQIWVGGEWATKFGLEADPSNIGFGHSAAEMRAVRPGAPSDLVDYHTVVDERTRNYLDGLDDSELNDIVDEHWDPPVTRAARLISVAEDSLQHIGQAAYLRGLLDY